jgi:hypothetical protein
MFSRVHGTQENAAMVGIQHAPVIVLSLTRLGQNKWHTHPCQAMDCCYGEAEA